MNEIVQAKLNRMKELAKNSTLKLSEDTVAVPPKKDGLSMVIRNEKEAAEFMMMLEAVSRSPKKHG